MKVYCVVAPPPGKGFGAVLEAMTVLANSKEEALSLAQVWSAENGYKFSRPINVSDVETIDDASVPGVIGHELGNNY
jgi:hypothetical protein